MNTSLYTKLVQVLSTNMLIAGCMVCNFVEIRSDHAPMPDIRKGVKLFEFKDQHVFMRFKMFQRKLVAQL